MKRIVPPTTRLRDETLRLFHQTLTTSPKGRLKQIEIDTGLSRAWLIYFHQGQVENPSVNNVECLYEYLTGRSLAL